jgi:DNA polymerase-1
MKNLIIDGGNLLHRTYHTSKGKGYVNDEGKDFSHVVLFVKNIKYLKEMLSCDRIFLSWDIRDDGFMNFRHEFTDYKEQRDRESSDDIHKFDKILWKITEKLGVTNIRANKLEGDDIIYFLCDKYSGDNNYVVSNDNDFLQLFNLFENVKIYNPNKKVLITADSAEKYNGGVSNEKYLLYKAIMGDKSDNIDGLYKYGPVKSKKFVENFEENFKLLNESDQKTIKRNLKVMSLKYASKFYQDEGVYFNDQDIAPDVSVNEFFYILDKMGIKKYIGYKMDWYDEFGKNDANFTDQLKNMLDTINN